ncbi:DUF2125 domain-containing protein [Devosia sp.]|uniref:DUF2125 domain-containing protein n=1 Tax=Devosia sp. TaxID=1871048 RepID=UPI003A93BDFE
MRKIIALGVFVLLLCVLWTAGWFWLAGEARTQVAALAQADGETTPQLTCGAINTSGFPFRVDLECSDATVRDADMTYRVDGLRASVLAYRPTHVIYSAHGPVEVADAFTGSTARLEFAGFEGSARVVSRDFWQGWRIARISMTADELKWVDTTTGDLDRGDAAHVELHLLDMPEVHDRDAGLAGLALYAQADGLNLPLANVTDGRFSIEGELTGLPDDLSILAADPDPVRNWQRRGGELRNIRIAGNQPAPDEDFEITGTIRLDDAGLADGDLTYRGKGVFDRLAGTVPPLELAAFKGMAQGEGYFGNTLAISGGAVRLLTFTLLELPALF